MSYKRDDTPEMQAACLDCARTDCDGECDLIRVIRREQEGRTTKRQLYTINGKTQNVNAWCKEYGIPQSTVYRRMKEQGLPLEEALKHGRPRGKQCINATIDGETLTIEEWANRLYIHKTTIFKYAERKHCDMETAVRHYMTRG